MRKTKTDATTRTVTVTEAARILGISRQTAYVLAGAGTLPGVHRLGGRFIVSKAALANFLQEKA